MPNDQRDFPMPDEGTFHDDPDVATDDDTSPPPYIVTYTVWNKRDDDPREVTTFEDGVFFEDSPIDCVNEIVYDLRGEKSRWELAWIDEIRPADGDGGTDDE